MEPAYANALKRKKELEKELEAIVRFLRDYKRFAGPDSTRVNRKSVPRRSKIKPDQFAELMEVALRKAARPMDRGELAAALEKQGIAVPSDDKPRYLGTILWRHKKKFQHIEGKGYWLRGTKIPDPNNALEVFNLTFGMPSVGGNST